MKALVLTGTKSEIVERLAGITGNVREAIVFVDEAFPIHEAPSEPEDVFVEMEPFMVDVADFDDSRDSIYSPADGE